MEIASRIKELMDEEEITVTKLSELTGVSINTLKNYIYKRREPNAKTLALLERYFGVTGSSLLGIDEETNKFPTKQRKSVMAQRIQELRISAGVTQRELAKLLNISASSVIDYENGLHEPNSKAMAALEQYFGVSGAYLRGEEADHIQDASRQAADCTPVLDAEILRILTPPKYEKSLHFISCEEKPYRLKSSLKKRLSALLRRIANRLYMEEVGG